MNVKKTKSSKKIVLKITMSMTGSYHTPKLGEENGIPVPVMEPTLPLADQSLPPSDQENIPPRMVTPPPSNVLVPVPEEEEIRVKECCQQTLAVRNQRAI